MNKKSRFCLETIASVVFCLMVSIASYADNDVAHHVVRSLIHATQLLSTQQKIVSLSAALLNKPYELEPLGEGETGAYNQKPLYRLDSFDCETYVDTVLALALSKDVNTFQTWINKIRYRQGKISFENRNHFTSGDWLPNNQKLSIIKNITYDIAQQATKISSVYIDRQNWYRKLPLARVVQRDESLTQRMERWHHLKALAATQHNVTASINYIPLTWLLKHPQMIKRIPNGAIIFLVLENPKMKKMIGTDNNISHMGFAIWQQNQLYLRAASTHAQRVIDVPFLDYLSKYLRGAMLQGISVWEVK